MGLHGHTKIELQDVNTGEKKAIEDDNMITNGLSELIKPANGWANIFTSRPFYQKESTGKMNFFDFLLGGIFCFQNAQEENLENYIRNPENLITAKASGYAYTGTDTLQGSYNIDESGIQEDGSYKKVWDFSTNQGNGTIASVSLTTYYGGQIGDGCVAENVIIKGNEANFAGIVPSGMETADSGQSNYPTLTLMQDAWASNFCYADYLKNEIYIIADTYNIYYSSTYKDDYFYNSGKIILKKARVAFSRITPYANPLNADFLNEDIEIFVPEKIIAQCNSSSNAIGIYSDIGYIYILMTKNDTKITPGGIINIMKVNVNDFSTEVLSVTNTSPVDIYFSVISSAVTYGTGTLGYNGLGISITNDCFIFQSYSNGGNDKIYKINLKNNADIKEFKMNGKEFTPLKAFNGYSSTSYYKRTYGGLSMTRIGDYLYLEGFDNAGKMNGYILNIKTCEAKFTKRTERNDDIRFFPIHVDDNRGTTAFECHGGKGAVFYNMVSDRYYNPTRTRFTLKPCFRTDVLMSINNLPTPVVKTASQTMKITYTITEE